MTYDCLQDATILKTCQQFPIYVVSIGEIAILKEFEQMITHLSSLARSAVSLKTLSHIEVFGTSRV